MSDPLDLNDPYSATYDRLWAILEGNAEFCAIFKAGNRIKLNDPARPYPFKENTGPGDYPEIQILPTRGSGNLFATSDKAFDVQYYSIVVKTGDARPFRGVFPIKWVL